MLDGVLDQGRATLEQMKKQNFTLKNAKKKMLDVANVMGLSSSLVGVIDRRSDRHSTVHVCILQSRYS